MIPSLPTNSALSPQTRRCGSIPSGAFKLQRSTQSIGLREVSNLRGQTPHRFQQRTLCAYSAKLAATQPFEIVTVDLGKDPIGSTIYPFQVKGHIQFISEMTYLRNNSFGDTFLETQSSLLPMKPSLHFI